RIPEPAGTQAELETPAAEQVQARGRPGEYGRWSKREVDDVPRQADPFSPGGGVAQQGPGVEEPRLVGMVLKRGQVQTCRLRGLGEGDHACGVGVAGCDEGTEKEVVSVVRHSPCRCPLG